MSLCVNHFLVFIPSQFNEEDIHTGLIHKPYFELSFMSCVGCDECLSHLGRFFQFGKFNWPTLICLRTLDFHLLAILLLFLLIPRLNYK